MHVKTPKARQRIGTVLHTLVGTDKGTPAALVAALAFSYPGQMARISRKESMQYTVSCYKFPEAAYRDILGVTNSDIITVWKSLGTRSHHLYRYKNHHLSGYKEPSFIWVQGAITYLGTRSHHLSGYIEPSLIWVHRAITYLGTRSHHLSGYIEPW